VIARSGGKSYLQGRRVRGGGQYKIEAKKSILTVNQIIIMDSNMSGESRIEATANAPKVERRAAAFGPIERVTEGGEDVFSLRAPDGSRLTMEVATVDGVRVARIKALDKVSTDVTRRQNVILELVDRLMQFAVREHQVQEMEFPVNDIDLISKLFAMGHIKSLLNVGDDGLKRLRERYTGREATAEGNPIRVSAEWYEIFRDKLVEEGVLREETAE
jgi:hypothetical protein